MTTQIQYTLQNRVRVSVCLNRVSACPNRDRVSACLNRDRVSAYLKRQNVSMSEQRLNVSMSTHRQCKHIWAETVSACLNTDRVSACLNTVSWISYEFCWFITTLPQLNIWLELVPPAYVHQVSYFSVHGNSYLKSYKKMSHSAYSHSWMQIKTMCTSRSSLSNERSWALIHTGEPAKQSKACAYFMLRCSITSKP